MTSEQKQFLEQLERDFSSPNPAVRLGFSDSERVSQADAAEALSKTISIISQLPIDDWQKSKYIQGCRMAYEELLEKGKRSDWKTNESKSSLVAHSKWFGFLSVFIGIFLGAAISVFLAIEAIASIPYCIAGGIFGFSVVTYLRMQKRSDWERIESKLSLVAYSRWFGFLSVFTGIFLGGAISSVEATIPYCITGGIFGFSVVILLRKWWGR